MAKAKTTKTAKNKSVLRRDKIRMCIDVLPPEDERERFAELARLEDPTNVIAGLARAIGVGIVLPGGLRAAGITAKKWANGRELKVAFLGGTSKQQEFVGKTAPELSKYANITFRFGVPAAQSDLRITFNPSSGAWSFMGSDCLGIAKSQATMNLGWLDEAVVLHEFCHALALIHEHQHPQNKIPWNKPAVYQYFGGPPNYWDQATIQHNLFDAYSEASTQFSQYDPKSVMHYAIQAELLTDPSKAVGWNSVLSASDTKFLGELYPRAPAPPPPTGNPRATVEFNKATGKFVIVA